MLWQQYTALFINLHNFFAKNTIDSKNLKCFTVADKILVNLSTVHTSAPSESGSAEYFQLRNTINAERKYLFKEES